MAITGTLESIRAAHAELNDWYEAEKGDTPLKLGLSNWTYEGDDHVEADRPRPVVFVGFNPGSGNGATENGMSRSERTWRTRCVRTARAHAHDIVFTELISLPTHTQHDLKADAKRLRELMRRSIRLNQAIIAFHRPKAVFQTGISSSYLPLVEDLYGLVRVGEPVRRTGSNETLLHAYRMADGTPWIAFRHFAAKGFSEADRAGIQIHAGTLGWHGDPEWIKSQATVTNTV